MEAELVLLRRFTRTGDAEAFHEIIRRHAGLVYGVALRILQDVDKASDVAQETFLQLTKDAATVTGSLPGWLHRVATHKAIDAWRKDVTRRQRESRYAASRPREVAEWKDLSASIDEGLNALDTEMREILVAHFLEGQTTRQIAGAMGISQATVSRRIDAGVTALRRVLQTRGILVAAGALGTLLTENAVQAAPQALLGELGKMALVGAPATAASSGGSWLAQTVGGAALAGVKAKAVAVAAVGVIAAGSVVTYHEVTKPSTNHEITGTQPAPRSPGPALRPAMSTPGRSVSTDAPSPFVPWWSQAAGDADLTELPVASETQTPAADMPMPGAQTDTEDDADGFALASDPHADPNEEEVVPAGGLMGGGMMGGMGMGAYRDVYPNDVDDDDPNR
ncbi:MAG TPA: sigma-70 family RNA polymerase sigma factor [Sedimentisphaerales bacterium]|nr:sigma-70 family RNA polymerase sigma factor [Sedimentisphaerales bacterium]HRS12172.1 sigma-70 family RNA polymerase sigma factor [Sedimentisphaerales bacterium]HRV48119.1 sigma-70 family RNA polymerase sigma factor [Sedimentisphaerales bacterium]